MRRLCGGCHGVSVSDPSPLPEAPLLRDLHRKYEPEYLAEALAEGIITGHPAMPQFQFEEAEIEAVILYLNSIQSRSVP